MKYTKNQEKKRKEKISFIICCVLFVLIFSYSLLKIKENISYIDRNEEELQDLYFAYYIDDQITTDMPTKESGYTLDSKSSCTNGVTISWDIPSWSAIVNYTNKTENTNSRTKCNLYFRKMTFAESVISCSSMGTKTAQCMNDYQNLENTLVYDDTIDKNLRYIGILENNPLYNEEEGEELMYKRKSPNNYVDLGEVYPTDIYVSIQDIRDKFSIYLRYNSLEECTKDGGTADTCIKIHSKGDKLLWRIIGVMNNVEDGTGKKESRIKLVRDYYTEKVMWENPTVWEGSILEENLNTTYFNSLPPATQEKIGTTVWKNGVLTLAKEDAPSWEYTYPVKSPLAWYEAEHGSETIENNNVTWTGNIGILNVSDIGYAMPKESILGNSCTNLNLLEEECTGSNWLMEYEHFAWLMNLAMEDYDPSTRVAITGYQYRMVLLRYYDLRGINIRYLEDHMDMGIGMETLEVYPTLYLDSNAKIITGEGSKELPYQISMD